MLVNLPANTVLLVPSKALNELNWQAKTHWNKLAEIMVEADLANFKNLKTRE